MSTHKHFDRICCVVLAFTLILTVLFMNAERFGIQKSSSVMGYEKTLFDISKVHTINIVMDNWDEFTANCTSEEYYNCTVVIDNEAYKNVAIRGKGNTSLTQVASYGNNRYSFKIEFDHYDSTKNYYGLDKLCLNNIIQDNTYMKDYLTYRMMNDMGVASPLCSYAYITVNGEDWGLYLAVEGVEESFLQRNYGRDYGELYKPDSSSMGGGRGNGEKFDMDEFFEDSESKTTDEQNSQSNVQPKTDNTDSSQGKNDGENGSTGNQPPGGFGGGQMPGGNRGGFSGGEMPDNMTPPDGDGNAKDNAEQTPPDGMQGGDHGGSGGGGGMQNGSDDVLLKYIDDDIDSYTNIFDNAKTDVTEADKNRLISALKKLSAGEDLEETVDIDAVIRYFVVHNFVLNFDSYTGSMIHNYYLYEKDGQLQMIPWDYNLAFGGFQSSGGATSLVNYPIDSPVSGGNAEDRPMIAWIFANDEYTELYHQYFAEFISEYFDSGYFAEMIDGVNTMISPYVEKDPTKFCTYEEFQTGISTLKEFCLLRAESISGQLDGTIASTSDTQTSDTLIDAGNLQINDMGSMNNTMGGGDMKQPGSDKQGSQGMTDNSGNAEPSDGNQGGENLDSGSGSSSNSSGTTKENGTDNGSPPQMPENAQGGDGQGGTPPDLPDGENGMQGNSGEQKEKPDGNSRPSDKETQTQEQDTVSADAWITLGISVLVLASGLTFAAIFKKRK